MVPEDGGLGPAVAALEQARSETSARVATLERDLEAIAEAAPLANVDDEHDPEGSTIAFERSQTQAVLDSSRRSLTEIDAALARVASNTYGTCERCGTPIAPARLEARPTARTCIACAS